jgi:2-oxo-4-hydroxy-4-carboxy-5-ureidoimidazoline decarboxylase
MSETLAKWNRLPREDAAREILPCCGSGFWAREMAARRPFADEASLLAASEEAWRNLAREDWMEAFRSHPRIGESQASAGPAAGWSSQEQRNVSQAAETVKAELAVGNREYERRFGHIFIVCASGRTAPEILAILRRRLQSDDKTELREAAEEQRQIMLIRLRKWLSQ